MPVLPITIHRKHAVYTGAIPYVCSNSDYEVVFTFDAGWEAYTEKTARFCTGEQYVDRIFTGNTCPVPVFEAGDFLQIGVFAGNLQTSTAAMVRMCDSIRTVGGVPAEPEPTVYDQIMERLNSAAIGKHVSDYRIVSQESDNTNTLVLIYNDGTEMGIPLPQMGGEKEVYWATYGVTPHTELLAAHQSGKLVCVEHEKRIYSLSYAVSDKLLWFTCVDANVICRISVHEETWGAPVYAGHEFRENKVTSIDETSTDAQYPSAKAVYDFVQSGDMVTSIDELTAKISAGEKVITLAAGAVIEVSGTITLKAGTTLNGNGATISRAAGFEDRLLVLSDGCRIENLTIEGNRTAMVSPHWDTTDEIVAHSNCVIDGVTINNANEGIVVYGDDTIVRGCRLYNCGGNGIHLSGADRTRIEDCVIIGANKNGDAMENSNGCIYWCQSANDTVVTGCYCEDGKAGFGGIDGSDNSHLKIIGCTAKNCTHAVRGEHYRNYGDEAGYDGSIDVIISNNQFIDCGPLLLVYGGDSTIPGEGLVISGNLLTDTNIEIMNFRKAAITGNTLNGGSIEPHRCPHAVISDNVIENPTNWGIYTKESPNINISGNSIRCLNYGVTTNNCPGIVIHGNTIR
ncbi:MAG: right-handed parallel beta-helix repeat-containing protein, partial [Clostridia bacterium]|nr:right-handed parallel beta-helix repeat-containing protein [Clostridia bacterium]